MTFDSTWHLLRVASALVLATGAHLLHGQTLLLDNFNAGEATGQVAPGSTWEGNVTQNPGSITVGGDALDENAWFAGGFVLDATGMNFLTIVAQRESGNAAPSLAVQFEDPSLNTTVISVPTSEFAEGEFTTVSVRFDEWSPGFDFTQIMGWSLGGGSLGIVSLDFTFDELYLEQITLFAPEVTSEGSSVTVDEGQPVSFTVEATGTEPLTYQWFKDIATPVTGNATATSATLVIAAADPADAGSYTCVVTNTEGSDTSPAHVLAVRPQVAITIEQTETIYNGSPQPVVVTTNPSNIATAVTYDGGTTAPTDAGSYAVVVTVTEDGFAGSEQAALVIQKQTPVITWDPGGPLSDGDQLSGVNLSAQADVAGSFVYNPPVGTALATGEHVLEAQFTPTDTTNVESVTVTRFIAVDIIPPTVTQGPQNQSTFVGQTAEFSVDAFGPGTLQYEWSKDGQVIPGATSDTLQLVDVTLGSAGQYSVRVFSAAGSAPDRSAQLTVFDISAAQEDASGGYLAGGDVTISNTLTYAGTLTDLTWSVVPPADVGNVKWALAASNGDDAATSRPTVSQTDLLEWQWTTVPASPLEFSYTLSVPAGASGDFEIAAMVSLTADGTPLMGLAKPDPLMLAARDGVHSADVDMNLRIDLSELLRIIELYNTRFGTTRTGRYQADGSTADGFAPDDTQDASVPTTLVLFHTADVDRNGHIDLSELLRVIELYNYREGTQRTGQYHPSDGTVDGFQPGPAG